MSDLPTRFLRSGDWVWDGRTEGDKRSSKIRRRVTEMVDSVDGYPELSDAFNTTWCFDKIWPAVNGGPFHAKV